jgi:transposase
MRCAMKASAQAINPPSTRHVHTVAVSMRSLGPARLALAAASSAMQGLAVLGLRSLRHSRACYAPAFPAQSMSRKRYPSDVSDDEWAFVAPYLTLMTEEAPQRTHSLREVFNGLRWIIRAGAPWRLMPDDLSLWYTVFQQAQRWLKAGMLEATVHDLCALLRVACGRKEPPLAVILDSRTLQSSPQSGGRAGYDGAKRGKRSKLHAAVGTLGHLLALHVTAANEQDRAQVKQLAERVQEATGQSVELPYVDQGYTGEQPAQDAATHGLQLEVIKLPEAKKGFVLLPRRWVVERSFGWAARFRRLARDYEKGCPRH